MKSLLRNHIVTGKVCYSEELIIVQLNNIIKRTHVACCGSTKRNELNVRSSKAIVDLKLLDG